MELIYFLRGISASVMLTVGACASLCAALVVWRIVFGGILGTNRVGLSFLMGVVACCAVGLALARVEPVAGTLIVMAISVYSIVTLWVWSDALRILELSTEGDREDKSL